MPPQWFLALEMVPAALGYCLIGLLIRRGMAKSYLAFLFLIGLHASTWLLQSWLSRDTARTAFLAVSVASWMCSTYVVCEVFGRMFQAYPGIARTGRRVIALSMLLALTLSLLTVDQEFGNSARSTANLVASIGQRVVSAAIVLYLTLILIFLRWMPVPLPENTVRHTCIFFFYSVSGALILHFWNRNAGNDDRTLINLLLASVSTISYAVWAWLLNPEGERASRPQKPPTADSERILGQLEALNRALDRGIASR